MTILHCETLVDFSILIIILLYYGFTITLYHVSSVFHYYIVCWFIKFCLIHIRYIVVLRSGYSVTMVSCYHVVCYA